MLGAIICLSWLFACIGFEAVDYFRADKRKTTQKRAYIARRSFNEENDSYFSDRKSA